MSGTVSGGKAAAITNKAKYGADFYVNTGRMHVASWIANGRKPRGFAYMVAHGQREKVREAGRKGGRISKKIKEK